MDEITRCSICDIAVPSARAALGKFLGTAVFGALGLKKSNDPIEQFVMLLIGLGLGHVADTLIRDLARPLCGTCHSEHAT